VPSTCVRRRKSGGFDMQTMPISQAAAELMRAGETCAQLLDEAARALGRSVETADPQLMRELEAANLDWRQASDRFLNAVHARAGGGQ